jgi:hypothetical protein
MNIIKKIQERSSKKKQGRRERKRIQELLAPLCVKRDYYDPREQQRLLIDLDDAGIGFPGGT